MKRRESLTINSHIDALKKEWMELLADTDNNAGISSVARRIRDLNNYITPQIKECREKINGLSKEYNPSTIAGEQKELRNNLNSAIADVKKTAREMVSEYAETEKSKINKMISVPPTAEQLSLLSSLNMRKNIGQSELAIIAESVADNYQATRILSDIAKSQGCYLSAPIRDVDEMTDAINKGCEYLSSATDYVDLPLKQIPESKRFFFRINPKEQDKIYDPRFEEYANILEGSRDLKAVKIDKTGLNAAEKAKVADYMDAVKNEDMTTEKGKVKVRHQIEKVLNEHPEDVGLFRLSDYKDTVKAVERKRAITIDPDDTARHHFKNTNTLIAYINDTTKGLEGDKKAERVNSILSSLPKQQQYAYDYYKTYGEVVSADSSKADDAGDGSNGSDGE